MTRNEWVAVSVAALAAAGIGVYATYATLDDSLWPPCDKDAEKCKILLVPATVNGVCGGEALPDKRRSQKRGVVFIWKFDDPRYKFCGTDGIRFKSVSTPIPDDQFPPADRCRTDAGDDSCPPTPPACTSKLRIKGKNLVATKYEYEITFTDTGTTPPTACKIDPWVRNG